MKPSYCALEELVIKAAGEKSLTLRQREMFVIALGGDDVNLLAVRL